MDYFEREFLQAFSRPSCGFGNVVVPSDTDRDAYIATCFATETVSVMPEAGGMSFNRVPVTREVLQDIEFPEGDTMFGSKVVYLLHPKTKFPIIVGVISKRGELVGVQHKQFKFFKENDGNYVSVVGDGKRGNLYVTVKGDEDVSGGQIMVQVLNGSNKGLVSLSVQGDIQLIHSTLSVSNMTTKIASTDKFEVATKEAVIDASDKVSLGSDDYEPLVLGKTLKDDILTPLLDALQNDLMVSTAMGPSGTPLPTFVADITKIKAKLEDMLSKKVETE